jgi:hypothetical protein
MKDDGGPAFPVLHTIDGNWAKEPLPEFRGMTLRDYFAAKAMQGMLAEGSGPTAPWFDDRGMEGVSAWAYIVADAMLKERPK